MTTRIRTEDAFVLRFGGGINSRASEDQIDERECSAGRNFVLDPGNMEFRPRPPFDNVGTVPNGGQINGFATLKKSDGTVSMLVQGGSVVYEWDGLSTFTQVGTCASTSKLRGTQQAQWTLDDKVIITDLNLADDIYEWNGTTFQTVSFLTSDGSTSFGTLRAKYALVDNERLLLGNLYDNGATFPHLLVGSKRGDFTIISNADRPSTSLSEADPWFLPTPQLKPINGLAQAYNVIAISQESGAMEQLIGSSAKDFALTKLHKDSGASGTESVVSTENDIMYGRPGVIESLADTDRYGDTEVNDPSFKIQPDIKGYSAWTCHFNRRLHRLYAFPSGASEVWVCQTDMMRGEVSPWSKWDTAHPLAFQPTAAMVCWDPQDSLEYLFMGDSNGNVYRMEGSGTSGDGGSASIITERTSRQFTAAVDASFFKVNGWVKHRKNLSNTLSLSCLWAGEHTHDVTKTIDLIAVPFTTVYGGSVYYGGSIYYGAKFQDRFIRSKWAATGGSEEVQFKLSVTGTNTFAIGEVGVRFDAAH